MDGCCRCILSENENSYLQKTQRDAVFPCNFDGLASSCGALLRAVFIEKEVLE